MEREKHFHQEPGQGGCIWHPRSSLPQRSSIFPPEILVWNQLTWQIKVIHNPAAVSVDKPHRKAIMQILCIQSTREEAWLAAYTVLSREVWYNLAEFIYSTWRPNGCHLTTVNNVVLKGIFSLLNSISKTSPCIFSLIFLSGFFFFGSPISL